MPCGTGLRFLWYSLSVVEGLAFTVSANMLWAPFLWQQWSDSQVGLMQLRGCQHVPTIRIGHGAEQTRWMWGTRTNARTLTQQAVRDILTESTPDGEMRCWDAAKTCRNYVPNVPSSTIFRVSWKVQPLDKDPPRWVLDSHPWCSGSSGMLVIGDRTRRPWIAGSAQTLWLWTPKAMTSNCWNRTRTKHDMKSEVNHPVFRCISLVFSGISRYVSVCFAPAWSC